MVDMSDLVTWLRQQLDEDERKAVKQLSGDVFRRLYPDEHEPNRGLVEVAAKRAIIDGHDDSWPRARLNCPTCCGYDGNDNYGREIRPREAYPCRVVRLLALPYANEPGYDETWRPTVLAPPP